MKWGRRARSRFVVLPVVAAALLAGSAGCVEGVRIGKIPPAQVTHEDPTKPGRVDGAGMGSEDIISATDSMVRDILASAEIVNRTEPARVAIDAEFITNESLVPVNKNLLTDRLRSELFRASKGKIVCLAPDALEMIEKERASEEAGKVTKGTAGETKPALGYDYRLYGRIASLSARDLSARLRSNYYQITFNLIERGTGRVAWAKTYEFRRSARDSFLYE